MSKRVARLTKRYLLDKHSSGEPMDSFRSLSLILGFSSILIASLSFSYQTPLMGGGEFSGLPIWHFRPISFPIWELLFFSFGLGVLVTTYVERGAVFCHSVLSILWLSYGIVWVTYGLMFASGYVLSLGSLAIFLAGLHSTVAKIWYFERGRTWRA